MARQRFIWPQLWDDPDLGRLPEAAMLLYIGCFSLADDDGRLIGDPTYIKTQVFRYRKTSLAQVLKLRDQVAQACSHFVVYNTGDVDYIAFTNWNDYQKPKYPKPSKLPPPPGYKRHRKPPQPSRKPSRNGSVSDSATGLGRVGTALKTLSSTSSLDGSATFHTTADLQTLGDESYFETARIVALVTDQDEHTHDVIANYAQQVPASVLASIRERLTENRKGAGWVVAALKSEIATRAKEHAAKGAAA